MTSRKLAVHVGVVAADAGGMAQVLNDYQSFRPPEIDIHLLRTTKGRGDRLWPFRTALAALRLAGLRRHRSRHVSVIVHLSQGGSFIREGAIVRAARLMGFQTHAHLHGSSFGEFATRRPGLVKFALSHANSVLCLAPDAVQAVRNILPNKAAVLVANPVSMPASPLLPLRERKRTVVFGGVVGHRKGADVLFEAWDSLSEEIRSGWTMHMYGPIEVAPDRTLPGVVLHGAVDRAKVHSALESCQVAVLPSRAEAQPVFLLEAMARACAVIGTRVGSVPSMLDHGAGLCIEAGSREELADALRTLIQDPALRESMSTGAYEAVATNYASAIVVKKLSEEWFKDA